MKPRTMASSPEISITPSRTRSSIVIGIGWSGPLVSLSVANRHVGATVNDGQPARPARPEITPSRPRGLYSGGHGQGHAALAVFATESRRCGIFLVGSALPVSLGAAACGDVRDQAGQAADAAQGQPGVAATLAAGR